MVAAICEIGLSTHIEGRILDVLRLDFHQLPVQRHFADGARVTDQARRVNFK